MAIRIFSDPVRVLSIGRNPIQVLLIRSDPVRVLSIRSDPVRSRFCKRPLEISGKLIATNHNHKLDPVGSDDSFGFF